MTTLRQDWAALAPRLGLLEPLAFDADQWQVIDRLHARFNDRAAQIRLPLPIARIRAEACRAILATARRCDTVVTADFAAAAAMAPFATAFATEVDALLRVLVPAARYRKGHVAYGLFTAPAPHGLHTDHSAEDPAATGEPICIARIATLATHCVVGDERAHDAATRRMLEALRYWTPVPEGEPDDVLALLRARGVLRDIPLDHVVLMVAGNRSAETQVTQHIAARPPEGGVHSAFFQRQYRLT